MQINKIFCFLLVAISLFNCSQNDSFVTDDGKARGALIEKRERNTVSKEQVKQFVTELDATSTSQYDVTLYYIKYRTVYQGKPINTSGLLFLPKGVSNPKLIAYFHGTQLPLKSVEKKQIPTFYQGTSTPEDDFKEVKNTGLTWASAGYAVFQPDYIGFAGTNDKEHPYLYYAELFNANVDGIGAAKAFMQELGNAPTNKVFIAGWSQGGGAALSANKLIQAWNQGKAASEQIHVVGTSCLAGPFNFFRSLTDVIQYRDKSNTVVYIQSWGIYAVNKFSGLNRPSDQIWKVPVYDQISSVFLGSSIPKDVYTQYFIDGMFNQTDTKMVDLCKSNSYHSGWTPTGKVFLYHGTADDTVQPFNSVDAETGLKNALTSSGGNPDNVQRFEIQGADHESGLGEYIKGTLEKFNTIQ